MQPLCTNCLKILVSKLIYLSPSSRLDLVRKNIYDGLSSKERFRLVCRGILKEREYRKQKSYKSIFCHRTNPFLQLGPFKIQVLSSPPIKLIVHDVFYDHEVEWIKKYAIKRLDTPDQVIHPEQFGNRSVSSQSNAVSLEMVWPSQDGLRLFKVYDRITLATGLFTRPPWASETLRVSSYGVAGNKLTMKQTRLG